MWMRRLFRKIKFCAEGRLYLRFHNTFGRMKVDIEDDGEIYRYHAKTSVTLSGRKIKVDVDISPDNEDGRIEKIKCDTYEALLSDWDKIIPDVLKAVIEYQNTEWDFSDPTHKIRRLPKFKTDDDALRNIELVSINIETYPRQYNMEQSERGRYAVLVFYAEWVNEDYGLLSVALLDEKVIEVTDQAISK